MKNAMLEVDATRVSGEHLNKFYDFLMTIPGTSVGSERIFSSVLICPNVKSSLKDSMHTIVS